VSIVNNGDIIIKKVGIFKKIVGISVTDFSGNRFTATYDGCRYILIPSTDSDMVFRMTGMREIYLDNLADMALISVNNPSGYIDEIINTMTGMDNLTCDEAFVRLMVAMNNGGARAGITKKKLIKKEIPGIVRVW